MDTFIVSTQCEACGSTIRFILSKFQTTTKCDSCERIVVRARKSKGYVYVLSNPRQQGIKVGSTERSVEERARRLKTPGTPSAFVVEGFFYSFDPKKDEGRAHDKLRKLQIDREHFNIDAVAALIRLANMFQREPMYMLGKTERDYQRQRQINAAQMAQRIAQAARPVRPDATPLRIENRPE